MNTLLTPSAWNNESGTIIRRFSRAFHMKGLKKNLTTLSVSLFNDQFKALSIVKNTIQNGWEKPEPVSSTEDLKLALEEAIQQTHFPGKNLAILVDDTQFIHRTIQLPPMAIPDLLPILERKAQQEKTWEGPAAWKYRIGIHARGKQTIQLEIWPQQFIDDLVGICEHLGLQLRQLVQASALVESQLSSLPVQPGHGTLLITVFGHKITLVAGNDQGTPILIRHLALLKDGLSLSERIGTEANRTLMYVNQQIHINIPQIWLLGGNEQFGVEQIQPHISTPIVPCPMTPDWKYWLWVGATLSIHHQANFTPHQVLMAPIRSLMTTCLTALMALLLLTSVSTTAVVKGYMNKHLAEVQAMTQTALTLTKEQEHWKTRLMALHTQRQWADTILQNAEISLEGPFFSYLGTVIPPTLILNKASISRGEQGWNVELAGHSRDSLSASLEALDHLVGKFEQGPYHMHIEPEWRKELFTQTMSGAVQGSDSPQYPFSLKGKIQS